MAQIVNGGYGPSTVIANYVQFWLSRLFDIRDAPRIGKLVIRNVDKIMEIIKVGQHFSSRSILQKLEINRKTVLNHLHKF